MTSLTESQSAFVAALRDPRSEPPRAISGPRAGTPVRRFNVYRNNVYAGLIGVIEARYPAVRSLVGDEFFKAMTRIFVDGAPPSSPVLLEYGAAFPDFIADFRPLADEPYMADVARLEWRLHTARNAADCLALRPIDLAVYAEHDPSRIRFRLAPAVSLVESPYPVFSIWRANTSPERPRAAAVFSGAESVLITRPGLVAEAVRLPPGCGGFIAALLAGRTLGAAADAQRAAAGDFPLQRILGLLIAQKAIASATTHQFQMQELQP